MMRHLQSLRERIAHAPTNRRGYRQYGRELRRDIETHAVNRVGQGASYKQIAGELGLADATLLNWCKHSSPKHAPQSRPMGFRPVEVVEGQMEKSENSASETRSSDECKPASRPVVVLPSGVRVEGITLAELPSFLERLACR